MRDAPASISVITHEEIMSRPVRDIGDIVQDVPGVYTESTKVGGNEIRMRGLGTAYTLILIDGKRQNIARGFDANGWAGTFSGFMPPASMIERVEVIRGPASIIYGSDAMGGVINIITKKHTDKLTMGLQADTKLAENHNVFGNQYGINGYINVPIIKKMLSINLRGGYKYGEQNSFLKPLGLQACSWATTNGNRVCNIGPANYTNPYATWSSTGFTNWNAGARINYTPTSSDYIYLDSEVYFARTGSLNTSGNQITAIRDFYKINNVLNHEGSYEWGRLTSYIQYSQTFWGAHSGVPIGGTKGDKVNWGNDGNGRDNKNIIFQTTYNKEFELNKMGNLIMNAGLYYMWEQLSVFSTTAANRSIRAFNQFAFFIESNQNFNEFFSTTLGLRYNFSDLFKAIPNPRFYVNYHPFDFLTLKAGIASGVLVPQLSYLYEGFTPSTDGQTYTYGNKNLLPEQSWNYELSAIYEDNYVQGVLTGYYTDFRDQVTSYSETTNCPVATCTYYANVAKSLMAGLEMSVKMKPLYGFSADFNYGFTYTEVLEAINAANAYQVGEPVNNIPRHNFIFTPKYHYAINQNHIFDIYLRWSGRFQTPTSPANTNAANYNATTRAVIGKYYKDYQLVDIGITYNLYKKYGITFTINNLFDVNFWDPIIYTSYSTNGSGANQVGAWVERGGYTNQYQRIMPSRSYWISFKVDF
ncbi:TonB-dependent receptor domain-containing protein [Helicobacter saguini]|uniref:TonB-dependent receptor domain-containing protein n=1 Tax=Helicobacter saguini TaxID=1548018 RepID=UPI000AF78E62|nr:TonB-dependent receptor [Helicobacter saguini]